MAGVAPTRGGGSNATTIGMIVSIVVNVALIAVLIILFTNQEQLRTDAEKAKSAQQKLAGGDENPARNMFPEATAGNKSLVGTMMQWIQTTSGRMTGNQNDPPSAAISKLDTALQEIREEGKIPNPDMISSSNGAVAIIQGLYKLYSTSQDEKSTAVTSLEKANADLEAALAAQKSSAETYSSSVANLDQRVATIQKSKVDLEETKNAEIQAIQTKTEEKSAQLSAMQSDFTKRRATLAEQQAALEQVIDWQKSVIGMIKGPAASEAQPLAIARKPVGQVLRALPGHSLVHIGLGSRDRVTLGMTFAVYSGDRRIPEDGRGKANVEVVSVGPTTSECRVINPPAPDDPILEGDGVGNIVLNRSHGRKTRFCVIGDFDIDGNGTPDPRGLDAVRALIDQYGGEVVSRVDATTDYLIIGSEPREGALAGLSRPLGRPAAPAKPGPSAKPAPKHEKEESAEEENGDDEGNAGEDDGEGGDDEGAGEDNGGDEDNSGDESGDDEDGDGGGEKPAAGGAKAGGGKKPAAGDMGKDTDDEDASTHEAEEPSSASMESTKESDRPAWPGIDHTAPSADRRAMKDSDRYAEAVRLAEALAIPRMPLHHFLNFVGLESGEDMLRQLGIEQ